MFLLFITCSQSDSTDIKFSKKHLHLENILIISYKLIIYYKLLISILVLQND